MLLIERETSDGDRAIVAKVDAETTRTPVDDAVECAMVALRAPTVYAVRVIWDRPDRDPQLRRLFYADARGVKRRWQP